MRNPTIRQTDALGLKPKDTMNEWMPFQRYLWVGYTLSDLKTGEKAGT